MFDVPSFSPNRIQDYCKCGDVECVIWFVCFIERIDCDTTVGAAAAAEMLTQRIAELLVVDHHGDEPDTLWP